MEENSTFRRAFARKGTVSILFPSAFNTRPVYVSIELDEETRDEIRTKRRQRRAQDVTCREKYNRRNPLHTVTIPLLNRASVHALPTHNRSHSARSETFDEDIFHGGYTNFHSILEWKA